jgi:hypothetical protein
MVKGHCRVGLGIRMSHLLGNAAATSTFAGWTFGMPPREGRRRPSSWIGPYLLALFDRGRPSSSPVLAGLRIVAGLARPAGW